VETVKRMRGERRGGEGRRGKGRVKGWKGRGTCSKVLGEIDAPAHGSVMMATNTRVTLG